MAAVSKVKNISEIDNKEFVDAVENYIDTKLQLLEQLEAVEIIKDELKNREAAMTEQMSQVGIKSVRTLDGLLTLSNAVFGSIRKDVEKEDAIPLVEQYAEFASALKYEPTLNSKILGSKIREMRDTAFMVWKAQQEAGVQVKPFDVSMYLPDDLIDVLNVSEEFTVRFTPNRET